MRCMMLLYISAVDEDHDAEELGNAGHGGYLFLAFSFTTLSI